MEAFQQLLEEGGLRSRGSSSRGSFMTVEEMYRRLSLAIDISRARTSGPNQIPFEVDSWAQALTDSWREALSRMWLVLHDIGCQLHLVQRYEVREADAMS